MRKLYFLQWLQYSMLSVFVAVMLISCGTSKRVASRNQPAPVSKTYSTAKTISQPLDINRAEMVAYAKQFIGVPYKYGSINPANGFDCSGFVYHVLTNFNINPPRSTYEYEHVGKEISEREARAGDIILFTGSDNKKIGHMGIVTENNSDTLQFIHSATSRNVGVIISSLEGYYRKHFVKIIRILK